MIKPPARGAAELPPTDHVARVLVRLGARDEAVVLLRGAIERDSGEKACAALLRAVEARPDASVWGPDLALDLPLVDAYARRGMLVEALAVLRGGALGQSEEGRAREAMLEELLAPPPADAGPKAHQVAHQLATGGAAMALSLLQDLGDAQGDWVLRCRVLLQRLLYDDAEEVPTSATSPSIRPGGSPLGEALHTKLGARDLSGALEAARVYAKQHSGEIDAQAAVAALERLLAAVEARSKEMFEAGAAKRTAPMKGHPLAELHVRMGNLEEAARFYRRIVLEDPHDATAHERLADCETVRRVIEVRGSAATGPSMGAVRPFSATVEALDLGAIGIEGRPTINERPPALSPAPLAPVIREAEDPGWSTRSDEPPSEAIPVETVPERPLPAPTRVVLTQGVDDPTKPTHIDVPVRARRPVTPQLLQKHVRGVMTDNAYQAQIEAKYPSFSDSDDDDTTAVVSLELRAGLLARQGYLDQAIAIFEDLAARHPEKPVYAERLRQLRKHVEQRAEQRSGSTVGEANDHTSPSVSSPEQVWEDPTACDGPAPLDGGETLEAAAPSARPVSRVVGLVPESARDESSAAEAGEAVAVRRIIPVR